MTDKAIKDLMQHLSSKIRVTKITATRSISGNNGKTFAGFTARTDSIEGTSESHIEKVDLSEEGQDLREARLTYYILAMQADLAAISAAWAGGGIPASVRDDLLRSTKRNYALLSRQTVGGKGDTNE